MVTPTVIKVDPMASQVLSPIRDEPYGIRPSESSRRSRRQAVETKNFNDMRSKYQETKTRMERMKKESENNKKMLLEMSGVLSALKDISVDYERDEQSSKSPALNVQRKIRAIDSQLKTAMQQCGHLEEEKELQSSTIKAQEGQIKTMEEQIASLQEQLKFSEEDKRKSIDTERKALVKMTNEGELSGTIREQEAKIQVLEDELRRYSAEKNQVLNLQIMALKGSNEAKYLEINAMDKKLQALRTAQTTNTLLGPTDKPSSFASSALVKFNGTKKTSYDHRSLSSSSSTSSSSNSSGYSSGHGDRRSLASISEEESDASDIEEDIYADDKYAARSHSSRASTHETPVDESVTDHSTIEICNSNEDEGVEVSMGKAGNPDASEMSYTTEASTKYSSSVPNFEEEYNQAMLKVQQLQAENQSLRKTHSDALSNMAQVSNVTANAEKFRDDHIDVKRELEEQRHRVTMSNARCEKLRRENLKLNEDLKEETAKYDQLINDYGRVAHREQDMNEFNNLKQMHSAVVMKMAELSDENDKRLEERNRAREELEVSESKKRAALTELDATKNAYEDLQKEHGVATAKLRKLTEQCDELKTKYYESLAADATIQVYTEGGDHRYEVLRREYESVLDKLRNLEAVTPSVEKLSRENTAASAKLEGLEELTKDLEDTREKYSETAEKAKNLERELSSATKKLVTAEKREQAKARHLKDMLAHYKRLEKEHEDLQEKVTSLELSAGDSEGDNNSEASQDAPIQLGPAGYAALADQTRAAALNAKVSAFEKRTKELQRQRDNAIDELNQVEEELIRTRLERREAEDTRKSREQDLKTVLGHYRELQKTYEVTKKRVFQLEFEIKHETQTQVTENTTAAMLVGQSGPTHDTDPPEETTIVEDETPVVASTEETTSEVAEEEPVEEAKVETPEAPAEESIPEPAPEDEEAADEVDSIARLLVDMETLKLAKEDRLAKQHSSEKPSDDSTVSNVSDGVVTPLDDDASVANSELSDEAPSTGWKDVRIAKLLKELERAKSHVWELEAKEETTKAQMEISERKLQVALREAEEAKKKQVSREGHSRDAVAQQKKVEKEYLQALSDLKDLRSQLEKAKKEAKLREAETKEARKRANNYHSQFKKLQDKLQLIEKKHPQVVEA